MTLFYVLAALFLIVAVGWRLASRHHSHPCPVWLHWLVELDNPFARTNRAAVIVEHLALQPGMSVLDMGCGPGRVTIPIARQVGPQGEVVAVDMQQGMLDLAQKKAQAAGLNNIRFVLVAAGSGKLEIGKFDRALLVSVLGEIPQQEAALRELYQALKPGGILSVTEIIFDPHFQRRSTVTQLAEQAGFRPRAYFGNRLAYTLNLQKPIID